MGMAAILLNGAEPFEQIVNKIEGPMWSLVKIIQEVSEKKTFKTIIPSGKGRRPPVNKILILTKKVYNFIHTL